MLGIGALPWSCAGTGRGVSSIVVRGERYAGNDDELAGASEVRGVIGAGEGLGESGNVAVVGGAISWASPAGFADGRVSK